jgi:hypothetical protein
VRVLELNWAGDACKVYCKYLSKKPPILQPLFPDEERCGLNTNNYLINQWLTAKREVGWGLGVVRAKPNGGVKLLQNFALFVQMT